MGGTPGPTVAAVLAGLDALGIQTEAIREGCNLPADLAAPDVVLPEATWEALWVHAQRARPEATLALEVGMRVPFGVFGPLDYLAGSAPTLGAALESLEQYFRLVARGVRVDVAGNEIRVEDALQTGYATDEFTIGTLIGRFGPYLPAGFVERLGLRRRSTPGFEALVGAPVIFDCRGASLTVRLDADTPMRTRDEALHRTMRALVDRLELGAEHDELERAIRARLRLHSGRSSDSVAEVAKALGMSTRTLHRRLADVERTWQGVVDDYRGDEAERLLAAGRDVTAVAFALGFKDVSSFSRAFKRWKGMPPSQWRVLNRGKTSSHLGDP